MHPAVSVILFTVTSGAGFGAMALIGAGLPLREGTLAFFLSVLIAGGLAVAGLLASTFHLGHPERAWRALSQWRSSWLSREGVLAIAALLGFGLWSLIGLFATPPVLLGWVVSALSLATIFTTSMIYAQLKTVPQWNSALTPAAYLAFGIASGMTLVAAIGAAETLAGLPVGWPACIAITVAWAVKLAWWRQADMATLASRGLTVESATGLGGIGKVRLFERPHTGANYLTREMVHRIGRKHAGKLRMIAILLGGFVPAAICALAALAGLDNLVLLAAFLALVAGLVVERWLFFAEATHSVSLYY